MSTSTIFRHVDHVDACGAPVLPAGLDLGICENEMPADTTVAIYGVAGSAKTAGFLTTVTLAHATREADKGRLVRIGATAFQVRSLAPAIGPGLTGAQARRKYLAAEQAKAEANA